MDPVIWGILAYPIAYQTGNERSEDLPAWLTYWYYNQECQHSAINYPTPAGLRSVNDPRRLCI
jgi:hypothetical protein